MVSHSSDEDDTSGVAPSFQRYHHLTDIDRVFCLSDLHTDHVDNLQWLRDRVEKSTLSDRDLVIVAGDISHEFSTFGASLDILAQSRCRVLFVPGNHEAWLSKRERHTVFATSLDKFDRLYEFCRERGVYVDPVYVDNGEHPVWILPLESWYDGTLSFDEALCEGFGTYKLQEFVRGAAFVFLVRALSNYVLLCYRTLALGRFCPNSMAVSTRTNGFARCEDTHWVGGVLSGAQSRQYLGTVA